jgi:hypothetical protein
MESGCKLSFFHAWRMRCFSQEKKGKRLVRLFRRTCAIESVFWKTPCRLFLPSLPYLVQCSSIKRMGKENSSDLASSFTRMLPHLRASLLHRYIIGRKRTPWFAKNIGAIQSSPVSSRPGVGNFNSMYLNQS